MKTLIAAVIVGLVVSVAAATATAAPKTRLNIDRAFSVSQPLGSSCAGFFDVTTENVDGWSGRLRESYVFDDPAYMDLAANAHADWSSASGMSYKLRFDGTAAGPAASADASGSVTIRRGDGVTLSGAASYASGESLIFLQDVSCG